MRSVASRPRFGCLEGPTGAYWSLLEPPDDLSKYMVICLLRATRSLVLVSYACIGHRATRAIFGTVLGLTLPP
jgi:hypothetical protein